MGFLDVYKAFCEPSPKSLAYQKHLSDPHVKSRPYEFEMKVHCGNLER